MGQIDVFLTNSPNQVINRDTKNEFNKSFNSDHDPFTVKIEAQTDIQPETKQHQFAFNKADWRVKLLYTKKPFPTILLQQH